MEDDVSEVQGPRRVSEVDAEPAVSRKPVAIRTGLFFIEETTGLKLAVYVCSGDDECAWLEDETLLEDQGIVTCSHNEVEEQHRVVSLLDAVGGGWLELNGDDSRAFVIEPS